MKFTTTAIAELKLPEGKTEHLVWDDDKPGFGIRLGKTKTTWLCAYKINGIQRKPSLGDIRKVSLTAARKNADQHFAQVELGIDPGAKKEEAKAAEGQTFGAVALRYLAMQKGVLRAGSYDNQQRHFLKHCAPLANRPIAAIKRADIAVLLQTLIAKSAANPISWRAGTMAGRAGTAAVRMSLSGLFKWAMGEGICESNPVIATNDPGKGIKTRSRTLTDEELGMVWRTCDRFGQGDYGKIVQLLILTGCRQQEIAALHWSEVDLDTGVLRIPAERTKNKHPLVLTLPRMAIDILRSAPPRDEGRKYVFGNGSVPTANWDCRLKNLHLQIAATEGKLLDYFVLHDMRRSISTGMAKLGIAPHVAERVLNHKLRGIEGVYNTYSYEPQIKTALAIWADHVASIIEGKKSNVTPLRRA